MTYKFFSRSETAATDLGAKSKSMTHPWGQWAWTMEDKIVWKDERQCTCTYALECVRGSTTVVESLAVYYQYFGVLPDWQSYVLGVSIKRKPSLAANLLLCMDSD